MNKILYLSYDGLTDPLGQSQILPYLKKLSIDAEIHIISSEKKENFTNYEKDVNEFIGNSNIFWHPIKYRKYPPILSTIYDLFNMYLKSLKIHKNCKFSVIHCRSHLTAILGHYLKKKINVPYIFDMRSFFPDERVDGKLWPQDKFIYKFIYSYFKRIEKEMLNEADHIVVLTEKAKQILSIDVNRISVIPCCADFSHFDYNKISEESTIEAKKNLGIKESDFVLTYLGSLGTWYLLDEMLNFFKELKVNNPKSVFLFLSPTDPNFIYAAAKQKGININDIYVKFSPRKELPLFLSVSSLSIFFIKNTFSKAASSPTKLGEIMGMGIPVIVNSGVGDTDEIVLRTTQGSIVNLENNNPYKEFFQKIDKLKDVNRKSLRHLGLEIFSLNKGVELYRQIYLKLENQN
jgi:glycosyltransferase involved in cell wall biosynthesis